MDQSSIGFPKYPQLPLELRVQIIEEAVATRKAGPKRRRNRISVLAFVDPEWNQVIEKILFRNLRIHNHDLKRFGIICGKRHGLLKRISCKFVAEEPRDSASPKARTVIMDKISQLFHTMKNWSRADRPHGLIKLSIFACVPGHLNRYTVYGESAELKSLPEVPAIGRMYAEDNWLNPAFLSFETVNSLHEKLPNLHSAQLSLRSGALLQETIDDARDRIIASHATKPGLRKLVIVSNLASSVFSGHNRSDRIVIAKSITPQLSLWKDSLVCLRLNCVIDVPQFLLSASKSQWPSLDRIDMVGIIDDGDGAGFGTEDRHVRACSDLLRGIIAALPSMRSLTRLGTWFNHPLGGLWVFSLCIDLGGSRGIQRRVWHPRVCEPPEKRAVLPCCPVSDGNAVLISRGTTLPEHLVTELQGTVWQHRQVELSVFRCEEDGPSLMGTFAPTDPCTQWNKRTGSWEPAFMNDMDIFIYDMGQYWEQVQE